MIEAALPRDSLSALRALLQDQRTRQDLRAAQLEARQLRQALGLALAQLRASRAVVAALLDRLAQYEPTDELESDLCTTTTT
jgi:hypothetical protein